MILKKLEIYGFKSFADRIYMKFDNGITAIVGPNGSGKSNIADAVRWVLGEQSVKSLRGSKMEDVIFSGTETRKSLGFAEVSLTLDNTDGTLPVEYTEITITRRVYRSGESEYHINRSACRLKDIVMLFMDTGVGKEGYSIIGQGRIDEILSNRSEERRYIFEEAAGIVKYKTRREEADKKLEKTQDNLLRAEDILSELEQHLQPLEEQSRTAKEYLKRKEQLKVCEINRFLNQYTHHMKQISEWKKQIDDLEKELASRRNELVKKDAGRDKLSDTLKHLKEQAEKLRRQRYDLLNHSERLRGERNVSLERMEQYKKDAVRLKDEIAQEQKDAEHCCLQGKTMDRVLTGKKQAFEEAQKEASGLKTKITDLDSEISDNQKQTEETKENIIRILNDISDCKSRLTRYETMETNLNSRLDTITKRSNETSSEKERLAELESACRNKALLAIQMTEKKQKEKETLEKSMQKEKQTLSDQEESVQKQKRILEGERSRLKLLGDMKRSYEGFYRAVREILTACGSNSCIAGKVCGVVASLIQVPKDFEVAIETVLGGSLQHIVTEDEEDAKYLIGFLRENNYGRATFLPVSSIRGRTLNSREREALEMPGCLGVASELVSCDPKYRGILENLLGRVVTASDLDAAIRIARRFSYSFRIVTRTGDVVNPGGSMTGGSRAVKGTGILSRDREIKDVQQAITSRKSGIADLESEKERLQTVYLDHKQSLEKAESELRNMEKNQISEKEDLHRATAQKVQAEKELAAYREERKQLDQSLGELHSSIGKTKQEISSLKEENADIEAKVGESEHNWKEKLKIKEDLHQKWTDIRIQTAALQQEVQGLEDQLKRIQEEAAHHSASMDSKKQKLLSHEDEMERIQGSMEQMKSGIKEMDDQAESMQTEMEEAERQREKVESRFRELEEDIRDWNQSSGELTDKKYRFEVQCSRYEAELENFQNNIWEEYEITYQNALSYRDPSLTPGGIKDQIQTLKKEISALGEVNVRAIEEYRKDRERYQFLKEQRNDLITARENLKEVIEDITETMKKQFRKEFDIINEYFSMTFHQLFGGGHARLVLEDPKDVLSCGIDIIAQPPGKKLQNLSLLSGGERTLTAIAILFAILKHKPTPFCVLDEIDAALDDSNVEQFGRYVREFSRDTQFIIITHRKGTMEASDILYGIAMEEKGVSSLISVKFDEMVS